MHIVVEEALGTVETLLGFHLFIISENKVKMTLTNHHSVQNIIFTEALRSHQNCNFHCTEKTPTHLQQASLA
jgi:hypothetical protein